MVHKCLGRAARCGSQFPRLGRRPGQVRSHRRTADWCDDSCLAISSELCYAGVLSASGVAEMARCNKQSQLMARSCQVRQTCFTTHGWSWSGSHWYVLAQCQDRGGPNQYFAARWAVGLAQLAVQSALPPSPPPPPPPARPPMTQLPTVIDPPPPPSRIREGEGRSAGDLHRRSSPGAGRSAGDLNR